MTNAEFAQKDKKFQNACRLVDLPVSTRQASKWRNKKGLAFKSAFKAQKS
jgi:hypothetical protein